MLQDFLNPQLGLATQAFIRIAYGLLLLGTLLLALPHGRRFFLSDRWGGYGQSSPAVNALQNPTMYPLLMAAWVACAVLIAWGQWAVWAALVNWLICRYFFVAMRWKGVLRGMGAPGLMTYWLAGAVFLLEYTTHYAPELRSLALLVCQVDFALIMLSAGIYKFTAGYPRNEGMEMGMVNPEWGHWWWLWAQLPPGHWLFWVLNQFAWVTEVAAALMMLYPPTRFWGGLMIIVSFVFITTQIRLTLLCEVVMACGALFFHPGSLADQLIASLVPAAAFSTAPALAITPAVNTALGAALWLFLVLLPVAHGGMYYNFYARQALPRALQQALEAYTNFFGMIIWRVFSVDVVNFFILIYAEPRGGGERQLISRYGFGPWTRFSHVAESITITSVFTTLKYYPSNPGLFRERLLRYARTVPCPPGSVLVCQYMSVRKTPSRFDFVPLAEYSIDPVAGSVEERAGADPSLLRSAHAVSPVHEGVRPGSYVPLK